MTEKERFDKIVSQMDSIKNDKVRKETEREGLLKRKKEIIDELTLMNINPNDIDKEIETRKSKLEADLAEAEEILKKAGIVLEGLN